MPESAPLLPLVQKYFEHDTAATHSLETIAENEAVEVLKALPPPLAARAIKHLQISYPAALLKEGWLGVINGLIIGVVTAGIAWLWHGNPTWGW